MQASLEAEQNLTKRAFYDVFWNIKAIHTDGYNFILVKEDKVGSIVLNTDEHELRVCY